MSKILAAMLVIASWLGASAVLANHSLMNASMNASATSEARFAVDGAFRDGLYVGRLTAQQGLALHAPIGRWSTDKDRASFIAGYRQGYGDSLRD